MVDSDVQPAVVSSSTGSAVPLAGSAYTSTLVQIGAQKAEKKSRRSATDKFKNRSRKAIKRKRERVRARLDPKRIRKNGAWKRSTPSVKIPVNCCGLSWHRCTCFRAGNGQKIAASFDKVAFSSIPNKIKNSDIQYWNDTGDMSKYAEQMVSDESTTYEYLFPTAFFWRQYSNPFFWQALKDLGAIPVNSPPVWTTVRQVMELYAQEDVSCYGGLFYSGNVLQKFRYDTKEVWQCCTACKMSHLDGHIKGLKIVYHVAEIMKTDFQQLQKQPTRHGWRRCTEGFLSEIRARTKGLYGHYSMKITLDGVLLSQPRLEKVVSWWPMLCPAYKSALPILYPCVSCSDEAELFLAACHYHRQVKNHLRKFQLKESLAQLCWIERGVTT